MPLDKYQVMNAVLGSRQSRPWEEVWDSIDGERINMIKDVWFFNPEYANLAALGVAPEDMKDKDGNRVPQQFHYVVWNHGTGFAMSPLGAFMEPQVIDLVAMFGNPFPFSCMIEQVEARRSGVSAGYRIADGSIAAPELLPELAELMIAAPHEDGPQALEDFAKAAASA